MVPELTNRCDVFAGMTTMPPLAFALFIASRDGGSAFESECDFDVGMFVATAGLARAQP